MNIYTVSTGCYSDYREWKLFHNEKYTIEEFNNLVISVCKKLKEKDDYLGYGDEIANSLVTNYGFKWIKYINCHAFDYSYKDSELPVTRELYDGETNE